MSDFLVIGYGNTLRRDDGAGPWVAERVEELLGAQARCLAVPQLLPELADAIAQAKWVVFVDARQDSSMVQMRMLEMGNVNHSSGSHVSDPVALVNLTSTLNGSQPVIWLVTVPAVDFTHGEGLSSVTHQCAEIAVERIIATRKSLNAAAPPECGWPGSAELSSS